jgi:hypothetical protein
MDRRAWRTLAELLLLVGVLSVALTTFAGSKAKVDGDEAEWIGTAYFFERLFIERDLSAEAWPDEYWTRTQPMVARYVIGAWLWARGYPLDSFNPDFHHSQSWAANQRLGHAPSNAMLDEARWPMRVLAALTATALYLTVRLRAGPIGGLAAALLVIGSPYLTEHLIRAKGDTPLMFFLSAALLAAVAGFARTSDGRPRLGWGVVAGAALGLALGAKLTAALAVLAVALWGAWAFGAARWRAGGRRGDRTAEGAAVSRTAGVRGPYAPVAWAALVLVTAALLFVVSNPFLYPDPVGRTWLLFQNRQQEMAVQMRDEPGRAHHDLGERVGLVWERSLFHETWGMSYPGWPVEATLALLGAGWLAARAARRRPGADALLLLWTTALFAGVTWGLGYRMQHYFVPTALTATLLAGMGAGWVSQAIWRGASRRISAFSLSAPPLRRPPTRTEPSRAGLSADG